MNTCPNCGLTRGLHSSILPGCMCQYEVQLPQKKEWIGLTENDFAIWKEPAIGILRWAEATLKEKNT